MQQVVKQSRNRCGGRDYRQDCRDFTKGRVGWKACSSSSLKNSFNILSDVDSTPEYLCDSKSTNIHTSLGNPAPCGDTSSNCIL